LVELIDVSKDRNVFLFRVKQFGLMTVFRNWTTVETKRLPGVWNKIITEAPPHPIMVNHGVLEVSHPPYSPEHTSGILSSPKSMFIKLWSADHKWSSGSALVVLLD
jgi:hypothetical protein